VPESGLNGASITSKLIDKLVFLGPENEVRALESLLVQLDVPVAQVQITAGIYEFQSGRNQGSAIAAALKLFGDRLGLTFDGGQQSGGTIRLRIGAIDAVLSTLDQDSRFRYVARPNVLVKDGETARFFAGEDVRVIGAVVVDRTGNPVQSKETLSAGVTLEATPHIRSEAVDLSLYQAVSNFVAGTGADPSILKRDLRSRLVVQPGYVYAIGGLKSSRTTQSQRRFFGFSVGSGNDVSDAELFLLLTVTRADGVLLCVLIRADGCGSRTRSAAHGLPSANASTPTLAPVITSPPCFFGLKAASI
jgi:type II secretory pathway component GspD/PulD (secretin)